MKRMPLDLISGVAEELEMIENSACGFGRLIACTVEVEDTTGTAVIRVTWDEQDRRWFIESEES